MEFSTRLTNQLTEAFATEVREFLSDHPDTTAGELEAKLRKMMHKLAAACFGAALKALDAPYPEEEVPCSCGGRAKYQFRRTAKILSVFGWVSYRRAYYLCPTCHQGRCPLDEKFGLRPGQVSVTLASLLALMGIQTAFEEASRLVEKLLLVKVSENTVLKEAQHFGRLQEQEESHLQAQSQDLDHLQSRRIMANPPRRLYGSLDGTHIPLTGEWREMKIGAWYEVEPTGARRAPEVGDTSALRAKEITYYCDLAEARVFGDLVWASGCERSADVAEEIVFVADGAPWIWNLVQHHFPYAVQIVDWYHAAEYLAPIAHAAFGEDSPEAEQWLKAVRTDLWNGQVQQVIAACRNLEDHPQTKDLARKAITYYTNNAKRMDYSRLRSAGYQIGSGTVESGCKQIATHRLKRAGARWTEKGARYTAKARAAWLSGQWDRLETLNSQLSLAA